MVNSQEGDFSQDVEEALVLSTPLVTAQPKASAQQPDRLHPPLQIHVQNPRASLDGTLMSCPRTSSR